MHHDDGQLIAHGILSQEPHTSPWLGVNITPTHARVTIQQSLIPAAVLPLDKKSLDDFRSIPFDVVVKRSKLQTSPSANLPATHFNQDPRHIASPSLDTLEPEVLEFLRKPVSAEEDWLEDVDEPLDIADEADENIESAALDEKGLKDGLQSLPESPSTWPVLIHS